MSGNLKTGTSRTLSQKLWDSHVVRGRDRRAVSSVYVDLHLVHEVTSPQAFSGLRERGLKVRRPDLTVATTDHSIPTTDRSLPIIDPIAAKQVEQLATNCKEFGIPHYGVHSEHQGIVHVHRTGTRFHAARHDRGLQATATPRPTGRSAHWHSASAPAKVENVLATQCLLTAPFANL